MNIIKLFLFTFQAYFLYMDDSVADKRPTKNEQTFFSFVLVVYRHVSNRKCLGLNLAIDLRFVLRAPRVKNFFFPEHSNLLKFLVNMCLTFDSLQ